MNHEINPSVGTAVMALIAACMAHGVRFHWTPGVLMVDLDGLDQVLLDVADDYLILGFETFTLDGRAVQPRLDYHSDFGDGTSVSDALAAIADWPRDLDLWVETVLTQR